MSGEFKFTRPLLVALRQQLGLAQQDVADAIKIGLRQYQRFEEGTQLPSLLAMVRLARCLEIKPWLLFCDEPELIRQRTGLSSLDAVVSAPGRPHQRRDVQLLLLERPWSKFLTVATLTQLGHRLYGSNEPIGPTGSLDGVLFLQDFPDRGVWPSVVRSIKRTRSSSGFHYRIYHSGRPRRLR